MYEVALSTMWGIGQFPNLTDFFHAGQRIGFTRFELNHAVDSKMLKGMTRNGYQITSVHEPCPADISTGTLKTRNWLISAPDEVNRVAGVAAVQKSIDLAQELGAHVVIVHPGRVDIDSAPETHLFQMHRQGKSKTAEFAHIREQLQRARAAQAEINLQSVKKSLVELAEYAGKRRIRLGLENCYHFHEIPLPDELEALSNLGYDDVIGYWHDVGHAQVLENLGFGTHQEWLRRFGARIVGVHLHDVVGVDDHRAAGLGEIDWDIIAPYLPSHFLRTCEFQTTNSPEQVAAGVKWLVDKGFLLESKI